MGRVSRPGSCGTVFSNQVVRLNQTKKCSRTGKMISLTCFDLNPKTGKPYCYCVVCKPKAEKAEAAWLKTPNGVASRKIQNSSVTSLQSKKEYRNSAIGKEKNKRRTSTPEFLEACRVRSKTPTGKANRKRSYETHRLSQTLVNKLNRILHGGSSPGFLVATTFDSEDDVLEHFGGNDGYTVDWEVDHRIPRIAYDHSDPEDVVRCWSKANMRRLHPHENAVKLNTLIKSVVEAVPVEYWPKQWDSCMPTNVV